MKPTWKTYGRTAGIAFIAAALAIGALQLFTGSTFEEKEDEKYRDHFHDHYKVFALTLPDQLEFAGEDIPIRMLDVREKLDRELLVNTYWQSQTMLFIKRAHRWLPTIEPILREEGIPVDFMYLAVIESGLTHTVSPAGATGFWQLMKDAAKEFGLEVNGEVDERYHVEKSTRAACAYLRQAYAKFGSWTLAAASYNMGMGGLNNQLTRQKATNYFDLLLNEETSRYLYRILAAKLILENPVSYGFIFREQDLYPPYKHREVRVDTTIGNLADFAFRHGVNYKVLKMFNPWLRDNFLPNSSRKTYLIKIPLEPIASELVYDSDQVDNFARQTGSGTEHEGESIDTNESRQGSEDANPQGGDSPRLQPQERERDPGGS